MLVGRSEADFCASGNDTCDKATTQCNPTPNIGRNYTCGCKRGFIREGLNSCLKVATCQELQCTHPFTKCVEGANNITNASCICNDFYVDKNPPNLQCETGTTIVSINKWRCGITFKIEYGNLQNPLTKMFAKRMISILQTALRLTSRDYVSILKLSSGSVLVDFAVLLSANSTDNIITIQKNLNDEISNVTGVLSEYFPDTNQTISIEEIEVCQLTNSCPTTTATTPTTTTKSTTTVTTDNTKIAIIVIIVVAVFLIFVMLIVLFVRHQRRRGANDTSSAVAEIGTDARYDVTGDSRDPSPIPFPIKNYSKKEDSI